MAVLERLTRTSHGRLSRVDSDAHRVIDHRQLHKSDPRDEGMAGVRQHEPTVPVDIVVGGVEEGGGAAASRHWCVGGLRHQVVQPMVLHMPFYNVSRSVDLRIVLKFGNHTIRTMSVTDDDRDEMPQPCISTQRYPGR